MNWEQLASNKPVSAYSIYSGVLEYPEKIIKQLKTGERFGFEDWEIHEKPDNSSSEDIIKGFNNFYYKNYVNTIFPQKHKLEVLSFSSDFAEKTFRLSRKINTNQEITIRQGSTERNFTIPFEYIDVFLFPREIAFYCFKCDLSEFSFDEITLINNYFRNTGTSGDIAFIKEWIDFLRVKNTDDTNSEMVSFGNKLKVFSLIEHDLELSKEEENLLLYDLGTCVPIGSAAGVVPHFKPSEEFLTELIDQNKLSVFSNWSALCLLDTFTGFFQKGALNNFIWENGYFNLLYLQSLYVKNYLFKMNKIFYRKGQNHQKLEDELFRFNKYYNPAHISYNFLPTAIYKKIRSSLAINEELEQLRAGIERSNEKFKEKRDRKTNNILTIITILATFSVIWDFAQWLDDVLSGKETSINILSSSLTASFVIVLLVFFIKNRKDKD